MVNVQITVDDGPEPVEGALDAILAELKTRKVKAAFFILGKEVKSNPEATMKIYKEGHILGNHSWDHLEPSTKKYTDEQIKKQFSDTHAEVSSAVLSPTGEKLNMQHWRAPRFEEPQRLTDLLTGSGNLYNLSHCDFHADSKDGLGASSADEMLNNILQDISANPNRSNFRLLFHVKSTTAKALKKVLDDLVAKGHKIVDFTQAS